ncbi:MAG: hypothetical protein HQ578_06855 [Chloroflexi bacterium]|nr:hypothetical protein [Chloroflexota bacterium]
MQEEKGLAIREDKAVMLYELETSFAMATRQRELLEDYIKERLKPSKHYYKVGDDSSRKPSLTKEGAELICLPHALKGHYEWLFGPNGPPLDTSPYQITMKCVLESSGKFAGEGVGSASSYLTTKYGEYKPRQKDPGLCHNATVKMASKSAYIAATLNSTAASEFFTQDLEDDNTGSDKEKKSPTNTGDHWCSVHGVEFFKRGKMRSFGHPIKDENGEDTGDWCHERSDPPKATATAAPPVEEAAGNEPMTKGEFWLAAYHDHPEFDGKSSNLIAKLGMTLDAWLARGSSLTDALAKLGE